MPIRISLSPESLVTAQRLATARMTDPARQGSPHRPSARNPVAQLRGAAGELAVCQWAGDNGWHVVCGYEDDEDSPDIVIAGTPFEIMTAQVSHREITGFCVPPNKLWSARRRAVWGYLFVGTDGSSVPSTVLLQGACELANVDQDPARQTWVGNSPRILNHVIRPEHIVGIEQVAAMLRQRA